MDFCRYFAKIICGLDGVSMGAGQMIEVAFEILEDCSGISMASGSDANPPRRKAMRLADCPPVGGVLDQARRLVAEGFSVIPIAGKIPAVAWKGYQSRRATDSELVRWFGESGSEIGIVTGELSGVTVIDCDSQEARELAYGDLGIWSNLVQATTRGVHLVFKHDGERNTVRPGGVAGLDRRGEGGYVRCTQPERWTRQAVERCRTIAETTSQKC